MRGAAVFVWYIEEMVTAFNRPATYEDVLAAPENTVAEVIHGVLHTNPRPGPRHANAGSNLGVLVGGPFRLGKGGPGGWVTLDEPELHLAADIVVPDLAGWRRERMPAIPKKAYFEIVPDWICEILSPSTSKVDRSEKLPIYAREGVRHAWLLDPIARTLEVFRLESGKWLLLGVHRDDEVVRAEPFDAIELGLRSLWEL